MTFNIHHLAVHLPTFKPHPIHNSPVQHVFHNTVNSIHNFEKKAVGTVQKAERSVVSGVQTVAHNIVTTERSIVNDAGRFVQNTAKTIGSDIQGISTSLSMPLLIGGAVVVGAVLLTSRR